MTTSLRRIEMKSHQPPTFFDSYQCRLAALAEMHGIKPSTLKVLIEDALRKKIHCASGKEVREALTRVAKLKISVREIKFLFNSVVIESLQEAKTEPLKVVLCQSEVKIPFDPTAAAEKWKNMEYKVAPLLPSRAKYKRDTPVDVEMIEQAWKFIQFQFDSTVDSIASSYGLPIDLLEAYACDHFIFRRSGQAPCPVEWFLDYANEERAQGQDQGHDHEQDGEQEISERSPN